MRSLNNFPKRCKSERSCLSSQSGNGNVILDKETYVREALRIVWSNLVNSTNEESPVFKEKGRNEVNMSNVISSPPQNDNEALENEQSSVEPQRRVERHWIDLNKISDMSSSDDTLD